MGASGGVPYNVARGFNLASVHLNYLQKNFLFCSWLHFFNLWCSTLPNLSALYITHKCCVDLSFTKRKRNTHTYTHTRTHSSTCSKIFCWQACSDQKAPINEQALLQIMDQKWQILDLCDFWSIILLMQAGASLQVKEQSCHSPPSVFVMEVKKHRSSCWARREPVWDLHGPQTPYCFILLMACTEFKWSSSFVSLFWQFSPALKEAGTGSTLKAHQTGPYHQKSQGMTTKFLSRRTRTRLSGQSVNPIPSWPGSVKQRGSLKGLAA